ncbi:MAG: hypothetical protein GY719_12740 [bacterium]|nr:hypothetical protein [bacterium]
MSEIWVVNASPVIALAKVDHLHLLTNLSPDVRLPEPVAVELMAGAASDPARQAIESGWGPRRTRTALAVVIVDPKVTGKSY